jgi:hypothetical protein
MREDEPNSMATEPTENTENTEKTKIANDCPQGHGLLVRLVSIHKELYSPQRRKGAKDAKSLCFY